MLIWPRDGFCNMIRGGPSAWELAARGRDCARPAVQPDNIPIAIAMQARLRLDEKQAS